MGQSHRQMGDKAGLLGRLGDDGVAGGQRSCDLAEEDRQREVPRADADKDAAPLQEQLVLLAGVSGQQGRLPHQAAGLHRVVAAEIHRLTHLVDAVLQQLARLAGTEGDELLAVRFQQIRQFLKGGGTLAHRGLAPAREGGMGRGQRLLHRLFVGPVDLAH